MNILVISDNFSKGGLETHIDTYYEYLKKKNNIIFAFGNYVKGNYLNGAKIICDNFHFSSGSTIIDFQEDVEGLVKIIEENKIDVIHVHPFYGLFPALVAANITKTKIVLTAHGRMSLNFFNNVNDTILYRFALEEMLSGIFCVSKLGEEWLKHYTKKVYYLPNLLDVSKYKEHHVIDNKKWALISRLDADKLEEIIKFLNILDKLDIAKVDIYGSGSREEEIKKYVKDHHLDSKVEFKGYHDNLNVVLEGNYNGVMGQGRVALEALAMNYPTLLIGYGKIAGLIDKKLYAVIKDINFIPTESAEVTLEELQKQLKSAGKEFRLRKQIIKDFNVERFDDYLKVIKDTTFSSVDALNNWYDSLINLQDRNQLLYSSPEVFKLLGLFIVPYCSDGDLKAIVNAYSKIYELNQVVYNQSQDLISIQREMRNLNEELEKQNEIMKNNWDSLNKRVETLENTGLMTLIKRALKNVKKKFKKR